MPNGDLVAGGAFTTTSGVTLNRVARWNGTAWTAFGSGISYLPDESFPQFTWVSALAVLPNGDLVAGGQFSKAGTRSARGIARWDGSRWTEFPGYMNGYVSSLSMQRNGDLIVAGGFSSLD
ncbi:MAG: hypothetical protein ACK58T_20030, partial [Phycisphaerae bacterium]